jgi:Ca-activated chloride channel homolog
MMKSCVFDLMQRKRIDASCYQAARSNFAHSFELMYTFAAPFYFLLLPLLPLLWWWKQKHAPHRVQAIPLSTHGSIQAVTSWRIKLRRVLPWFKYGCLAACIVALARPQYVEVMRNVEGQGIDIMLAMDISPSMLAKDFDPDRLAVSKKVAIEFVDHRPVDRIGLVSFAGEALIEYPLTTDHALIKSRIDGLIVGELADGTAIGMGLGTALTRLRDTTAKSRIVILLTDGESNAGYYAPKQAMEIAVSQGVKVYTIGVGTDQLAEAPIARNSDGTYEFAPRLLTLDDALLEEIATGTGGKYFRATSEDVLRDVYAEIDQLERSDYQVKEMINRDDFFHYLLAIALGFLVIEAVLRWFFVRSIHD